MQSENQNVILFDGVCNLCNNVVQFIIKQDVEEKFKFASLQSTTGQKISIAFNLPTENFETFVYLKNDKIHLQSEACLHVLKDLGYPWKLFFVFIVIPKFIRDKIYNLISKRRYIFFGQLNACLIPTKKITERFL